MEDLRTRFAEIIDIIKKHLAEDIRDADLAKLLGTNENTLREYKKKHGLLKAEVLVNLIQRYKIDPRWLFKGEGEPFHGARSIYPFICGPEHDECSVMRELCDIYHYFAQDEGVKGSAGSDTLTEGAIAFRRDWLERKGQPGDLMLAKVRGDAMEPTLLSGDMVLINKSITHANEGGIYAISVKDEFMIRRIQYMFDGNKVKIITDNERYQPIEIDREKVSITGRVVWFGRDIER